jgi:hypothetical protein
MPYKDKAKEKEYKRKYELKPESIARRKEIYQRPENKAKVKEYYAREEVRVKTREVYRNKYAKKTMNVFDVWVNMVKEGGIGHYNEYHELFDRGILPTSIDEYSKRLKIIKIHTIPRNPMDFNNILLPRYMKGIHINGSRFKRIRDEYKRRFDLNMKLDKVDIMINTQKYTGKM